MGVYYEFGEQDVLYTVIGSNPVVLLGSGSNGWHGNIGPSSSLSLYDGIRSRLDVKSSDFSKSGISVFPIDLLDTHSIDKVIFVSGSYPATGSVRMVKVRKTAATNFFSQVTSEDWYEEHFAPIERLYDYYHNIKSDYFTGSYDFYSLFFKENTVNTVPRVLFNTFLPTITSSLTVEARIKPLTVTSSIQDFVIQGQKNRWKFFITGSSGKLAFSDASTTHTSSVPVSAGVWQHVCVTVGSGSIKFYIDSQLVNSASYSTTFASSSSGALTVGGELNPSPNNGFDGYMFESKVWNRVRTQKEISGSYLITMIASGTDTSLLHYARFNDGPLGHAHGFVSGSGAFDYSPSAVHGQFQSFNTTLPECPIWQPNDDPDFVTYKTRINDQINMMRVIHIPSMFYGRQIATGSVNLTCNAYANKGIVRVLKDDGHGRLYVSGSMTKLISGEDYAGGKWNKVGNVFYTEGLIVITDPSLLDFGSVGKDPTGSLQDTLQVSFCGYELTPTKVFMCKVGSAQANASNNKSYTTMIRSGSHDGLEQLVIKQEKPTTWITAVGLYNENRKLVAIAKLAQPIRKREKDKLLIRLRQDF